MSVEVSVVCPFYNEVAIIEKAIQELATSLEALGRSWELLVVNDGSTDGSRDVAERTARAFPNVRVLGYPTNRGRGFALRTGIEEARGEIIVTTEIDLSWGEHIVHELVEAMEAMPDADIVVASPHLPGGGYKNVPLKRVILSTLGNRIIRAGVSRAATMNTGMTRAYRRDVIRSLPLFENGKEFHLEVILKAYAFGYRIREIPAMLEWKEYKHRDKRVKRKSSSNISRLVVSHSFFSLFANPVHYLLPISLGLGVLALVFLVMAVGLKIAGLVAAYSALAGFSLAILAVLIFVLAVVSRQGNMIQQELWSMQRILLGTDPAHPLAPRDRRPHRDHAEE